MQTPVREQIETALRTLSKYDFATAPLWKELAAKVAASEHGTPGELDLQYTVPGEPPALVQHLEGGQPQVLSASVLWTGYHYTLSPGQRTWLREHYDLTPAQTVTIDWVEVWKGTYHPRSFKLVSDMHVDPRNRKHILIEAVIKNAAQFFHESALKDAEKALPRLASMTEHTLTLGNYFQLESYEKWVMNDLGGVKLTSSKVQLTAIMGDTLRFEGMQKSEMVEFEVSREELLHCCEENRKMLEDEKDRPKKGRGASTKTFTPSGYLDELEKEFG